MCSMGNKEKAMVWEIISDEVFASLKQFHESHLQEVGFTIKAAK